MPLSGKSRQQASRTDTTKTHTPSKGTGLAFGYVATLFYARGLSTFLIDPLIAAVKKILELSYTQAFVTTFARFIAFGVASLPVAAVFGTAWP